MKIKALRQDNVGENKAMEKEIIKQNFEYDFKYTAVWTPQQTLRAETVFITIAA